MQNSVIYFNYQLVVEVRLIGNAEEMIKTNNE